MGWRKKDNCHVLCVLFVQYQWMLQKNPLPTYIVKVRGVQIRYLHSVLLDIGGFDNHVSKTNTDVEQLMDSISQLSQTSSYLILNFSTNMPATSLPNIDELDELLSVANWKKVDRLMFGEEGFHYDRYPKNKLANQIVGFAMYEKEWSIHKDNISSTCFLLEPRLLLYLDKR